MLSQFPVVKIKLERSGQLSVCQHSETAEVAKSVCLKQDVNVVQPNWGAWLGICLGQNNGCLAIPNMLPSTACDASMDGCDLSAEVILFYGRHQTFFHQKTPAWRKSLILFDKSRLWWLSSSVTPSQLETVWPISPVFTKLPLWPGWSVLPVVPQYDKEKLLSPGRSQWISESESQMKFSALLMGTRQIKQQH